MFVTSHHSWGIFGFFQSYSKCLPVVIHILGGIFLKDAQSFVLCIILIAMDFYFVQNFSGRYLVGMRWCPVSSRDVYATTTRYEVTKVVSDFVFSLAP